MPLPIPMKVVKRGRQGSKTEEKNDVAKTKADKKDSTSVESSSNYPHLLVKLKEHFKHTDFRSSLQRRAVETVLQGTIIQKHVY
jgi:hypothetical protein